MVRLTPTLNDTTAMPAKRDYKGHGHCFVFGSNFIFTVIIGDFGDCYAYC